MENEKQVINIQELFALIGEQTVLINNLKRENIVLKDALDNIQKEKFEKE